MVEARLDRRAPRLVWAALIAALVAALLAPAPRAQGQAPAPGLTDDLAATPSDAPLPSKLVSPQSATDAVKRREPAAFPAGFGNQIDANGGLPSRSPAAGPPLSAPSTHGQPYGSSPYGSPPYGSPPIALTGKEMVAGIRVEGLGPKQRQAAMKFIKTRVDRPYDPKTVADDVRRLLISKVYHPTVSYERVGTNGLIIIYRIHESPTIKHIKFVGNSMSKRHLLKQCGLKVGDLRDKVIIEDAKNKLLEHYQEKGFGRVTVTIARGLALGDEGVVFVINEGQRQKVWTVQFEGNTVAPDGRLKSIIKSKPPLLYLFKGEVERQRIDGDVLRLAEYYHGLGFFRVRIARELQFDEKQKWLTLRFIIDEGPRYKVRQVTFIGPKVFPKQELYDMLIVKQGEYFDKSKLDKDVDALKDKYGALGYVFAAIEPDSRFREEPGEIDLIYQIEEGRPCIVSRVDVKIYGDNPHTRRNTILNRVSLHPGDLLNTVELRKSERRLKGSALFKSQPPDEPKITFHPPDGEGSGLAERPTGPDGFRGQSPDRPTALSPRASAPRAAAPRGPMAVPPRSAAPRPATGENLAPAPTSARGAPTRRRSRGYLGIRASKQEAP
jgi:outer membrane protein insertion porin family